jgi:hypothetical protein
MPPEGTGKLVVSELEPPLLLPGFGAFHGTSLRRGAHFQPKGRLNSVYQRKRVAGGYRSVLLQKLDGCEPLRPRPDVGVERAGDHTARVLHLDPDAIAPRLRKGVGNGEVAPAGIMCPVCVDGPANFCSAAIEMLPAGCRCANTDPSS